MGKKAQVGMMETFMVLIIFFVLLMMGLFFYFKYSAASLQETGEEVSMLTGSVLLSSITSMPEIQCSVQTKEMNCIGAAKLTIAVIKNTFKSEEYSGMFKKKRVYVNKIYPEEDTNGEECDEWSKFPYCGNWTLHYYKPKGKVIRKEVISTPVSLYNPNTGRYDIGKIYIEVY